MGGVCIKTNKISDVNIAADARKITTPVVNLYDMLRENGYVNHNDTGKYLFIVKNDNDKKLIEAFAYDLCGKIKKFGEQTLLLHKNEILQRLRHDKTFINCEMYNLIEFIHEHNNYQKSNAGVLYLNYKFAEHLNTLSDVLRNRIANIVREIFYHNKILNDIIVGAEYHLYIDNFSRSSFTIVCTISKKN